MSFADAEHIHASPVCMPKKWGCFVTGYADIGFEQELWEPLSRSVFIPTIPEPPLIPGTPVILSLPPGTVGGGSSVLDEAERPDEYIYFTQGLVDF